jgi:hypothetical protein
VRGQRLVLDSSTHPKSDALTNSEAFLAGVSSCGVTLVEGAAQDKGTFELVGVSQADAETLVETYRGR